MSTTAEPPAGNATTYRFRIGGLRAVAVSDGQARFPAYPAYAPNAEEAEVRAALREHGLDEREHLLNATSLLLLAPSGAVLLDAGAGSALGPGFGLLPAGLRSLGLTPDDVATVHVTHAHLDHVGGLVDDDGQAVFRTARLSMARREWEHWTDPDLDLSAMPVDAEFREAFLTTARRALPPYAGRLALFEDEAELAPGVTATRTGVHTPGHSVVTVADGQERLLVVGDLFHHEAFDLAHPHWCTAFDDDPHGMPQLRRDLLGRAADAGDLVFAYHAPFPGLGRVFRQGDGFRFAASPWLVVP